MKTAAFELVKSVALAAAKSPDDVLFAYDALLTIANALGLRREAKDIRRILKALRLAEELQIKFIGLLGDDRAPKKRNGDGQRDGDGDRS